jgi:hypothetical protein
MHLLILRTEKLTKSQNFMNEISSFNMKLILPTNHKCEVPFYLFSACDAEVETAPSEFQMKVKVLQYSQS